MERYSCSLWFSKKVYFSLSNFFAGISTIHKSRKQVSSYRFLCLIAGIIDIVEKGESGKGGKRVETGVGNTIFNNHISTKMCPIMIYSVFKKILININICDYVNILFE